MAVVLAPDQVIDYLKRFLAYNKARGMVAELALDSEIGIKNSPSQQKLLAGGWILSPKIEDFHQHRYLVSVLPSLYSDISELKQIIAILEHDRGWQETKQASVPSKGIHTRGRDLPHKLNVITDGSGPWYCQAHL